MPATSNAFPELKRDLRFYPVDNPQPRKLSPAQIRQYNERGYIFPLDVFSKGEADGQRAFFDDLLATAAAKGWGNYSINGWHRHCQSIHDLVTEARILDYVSDLLGPDLVCWGTHYFCKMPEERKRVSWHQDASYWPLTPSQTVTVWLAIDDADQDNGAMQVIPGSHRHGQIDFEQSTAAEDNVLNQSVHGAQQYGDPPVALTMKAGQMSLHTDLLLHGSQPNTSTRRRCGLTMRFVPPQVRAHKGWNESAAVVCRGVDASGHWVHHPRPQDNAVPER
ncbi:MAG: phytanoyl-CoA dioxygenase family protein [Candidatus Latescibacteria bacterium]|nr:phytanoyl-CoA dioxygenase family protein [Candidatus Latescibacterota bacterium]